MRCRRRIGGVLRRLHPAHGDPPSVNPVRRKQWRIETECMKAPIGAVLHLPHDAGRDGGKKLAGRGAAPDTMRGRVFGSLGSQPVVGGNAVVSTMAWNSEALPPRSRAPAVGRVAHRRPPPAKTSRVQQPPEERRPERPPEGAVRLHSVRVPTTRAMGRTVGDASPNWLAAEHELRDGT